jgi:hypothetical protein
MDLQGVGWICRVWDGSAGCGIDLFGLDLQSVGWICRV